MPSLVDELRAFTRSGAFGEISVTAIRVKGNMNMLCTYIHTYILTRILRTVNEENATHTCTTAYVPRSLLVTGKHTKLSVRSPNKSSNPRCFANNLSNHRFIAPTGMHTVETTNAMELRHEKRERTLSAGSSDEGGNRTTTQVTCPCSKTLGRCPHPGI